MIANGGDGHQGQDGGPGGNAPDSRVHVGFLKPGFHMIVPIVPIAPIVSKYFETIRTTGAIGSFHMIVSIASRQETRGRQ